jgi:hypothetical protein
VSFSNRIFTIPYGLQEYAIDYLPKSSSVGAIMRLARNIAEGVKYTSIMTVSFVPVAEWH